MKNDKEKFKTAAIKIKLNLYCESLSKFQKY